ncbi:MAG: hypothetical protein VB861_13430 [Planctomycetaceae bacterium]
MELATPQEENPYGSRGFDVVCPPLAPDGTRDEKWRRRESNPQVQSRNSQVAQRLWNMLQEVGVSWEWNDDANRQPMALGHEELAEVITAWPLLSADLRQAILAHVVLHSDAEDSARFKNVRIAATREAPVKAKAVTGKVE